MLIEQDFTPKCGWIGQPKAHYVVRGAASPDQLPAPCLAAVDLPGYKARVERVVFIDIVAFDWNCPQHISRRYTESEFAYFAAKLEA